MAKKHNIPVVYHGHTKLYEDYYSITKSKFISKILTKKAVKKLNKADEVWCVSEAAKNIYNNIGVTAETKVIRNTTSFKYFEDECVINKLKKIYNIDTPNVLAFVSRMEIKTKNIDFLLRTLKVMKDKGVKFKQIMAGGGSDFEKIKDMAKELSIYDDCIFTGFIEDKKIVAALYRLSKLNVFPSICDNASVTILEAASQGVPSVCIQGSSSAEIITDGVNGYLSPLDETAFADTVISALGSDRREEVGENARRDLINKSVFDEVYNLYVRLGRKKQR